MQLLVRQQKQTQLLGVAIVMGLLLIVPGHCQTNERNDNKKSIGIQSKASTVKEALNEVNSSLHSAEVLMKGQKVEKAATAGSPSNKQAKIEQKSDAPSHQPQEPTKKTVITNSQTAIDNKPSIVSQQDASSPAISSSSSYLNHHEGSILNSDEEISDSLRGAFYFFVALSLSAIMFIVFKVYRLRLSRAERKYGVQGDRSTQELTPLPTAIEDVPSDDEDQTLFEVQRHNIRIL